MANRKTLAILEVLVGLTHYFEAIAEEETTTETQAKTGETTTTVEESPVVANEVTSDATTQEIENVALKSNVLPTPAPKLFDVIQPAPKMSNKEYKDLEQQTDEITARGNFLEMGNWKDSLLSRGLNELAKKVTEEFTKRNIDQAKSLINDRDNVLESLTKALGEENLHDAKEIFRIEMTRIGDRFKRLNHRAQVQLEILEGKKFGEIQNEFAEKVRDGSKHIEALKHMFERRERETIEQALAGDLDPKTARRVNELISRFQTNITQQALGAAESCYNNMLANRVQMIAHFKNEKEVDEVLHGAFVSLQGLRQQKTETKQKSRKKHLQLA